MKEFFLKAGGFFKNSFAKIVGALNSAEQKAFDFLYEKLSVTPFSELTEDIIFYSALAVAALLLILILVLIFKPKKRKYTFIIGNDKIVRKFKKKEDSIPRSRPCRRRDYGGLVFRQQLQLPFRFNKCEKAQT